MCLLWITLTCFVFIHQGSNMVSKVIMRGENIVLACDESEFNNFEALRSSEAELSTTSTPSKFSWFIKPFGKPRTLLASCTYIKPEYKDMFELLPKLDKDKRNLGCIIRSTNSSLLPAGTYECLKIDPDQKRFMSELVIIEEEPICRLLTNEENKADLVYSNSDSTGNSSDDNVQSILNGTQVTLHCSLNYSGHLAHKFHISLIGEPSSTAHRNNRTLSRSFTSRVDFDVIFDDSEMIKVSLSASFQSQTNDTGDGGIFANALVYQIHFPLALAPLKDIFYTTSQTSLKNQEVMDGDPKKGGMDGMALALVGVLIAMLLFVVFIFSFSYFKMNRRIRDIKTASAPVSGESVPFHLREANSLYDEINPDEETPEFNLNAEAYTKLNQHTLLRKIENDEVDSKLGSSKRSTYAQPGETPGNIYLHLVSSGNQQELHKQSKDSNSTKFESGKGGTLNSGSSKVNSGSYLHIPTTSDQVEPSLLVDMTYLHVVSDDKVPNNSSTYENTYS